MDRKLLVLAAWAAAIPILLWIVVALFRVDVAEAFSKVTLRELALFTLAFLAAEALRAARLSVLLSTVGLEPPGPLRLLGARLAGDLVSIVTPSVGGGEAVRGALASPRPSVKHVVVGFIDGAFDLVTDYALAVALLAYASSIGGHRVAVAVLAVLLGSVPVALWIAGLLVALHVGRAEALASRIRFRRVRDAVKRFAEEVQMILESTSKGRLAASLAAALALSIAAWIATAAELAAVSGASLMDCTAAVVYGFLMGVIPTPGGVGVGDAAMAFYVDPGAVIAWRSLWLAYSVVLGAACLVVFGVGVVLKHLGGEHG